LHERRGVTANLDDKPLPVVLESVPDEVLSSWLRRHARYYGVSEATLLCHCDPNARSMRQLDLELTESQGARLAHLFRRDRSAIRVMTLVPGRPDSTARHLVGQGRAVQTCGRCARGHAAAGLRGVVLRSWIQGWRLTCLACKSPLSEEATQVDASPATTPDGLWREGRHGEKLLEAFITRSEPSCGLSPIALMRLLLLPRVPRPIPLYDPAARKCRVLDLVVPAADQIKVNYANGLVLPLAVRVLLLAGVAIAAKQPREAVAMMRSATLGENRHRFDRIAAELSRDPTRLFSEKQLS